MNELQSRMGTLQAQMAQQAGWGGPGGQGMGPSGAGIGPGGPGMIPGGVPGGPPGQQGQVMSINVKV